MNGNGGEVVHLCTTIVGQRSWWLKRIEAILNDLCGKQRNRNNGKRLFNAQTQKWVVSLEKDMILFVISFSGETTPFLRLCDFRLSIGWETFLPGTQSKSESKMG